MKELLIDLQEAEGKASLAAIRVLTTRGVAVLPTDTVYGLHALAEPPGMARRLAALKGYAELERGFILLADGLERVERWGVLEPHLRRLLERLCPGPVSFILEARPEAPEEWAVAKEGRRRIAFRIPDHSFLLDLIRFLDAPLLSTSANLAEQPPLESAVEIANVFGNNVGVIVADAELERRIREEGAHPSALIDLTTPQPTVLREGRRPLDLSLEASPG